MDGKPGAAHRRPPKRDSSDLNMPPVRRRAAALRRLRRLGIDRGRQFAAESAAHVHHPVESPVTKRGNCSGWSQREEKMVNRPPQAPGADSRAQEGRQPELGREVGRADSSRLR